MRTKLAIIIIVIALILIFIYWWNLSPRNKTTSTLLPPPRGIRSESNGGTINVLWNSVPEADSYNMYYSNAPNFSQEDARIIEGIRVDGPGSFFISKVPQGSYYYRLTSVKDGKESSWSDEMNVVVDACKPSAAPPGLSQELEGNEVKLKWERDTTADGYVLYVKNGGSPSGDSSDDLRISIDDPLRTEHSLSDLDPRFEWQVAVASFGTHCGEGLLSSPLRLKVE